MSRVKIAVAVALLGAVMTASAVAIAGGGGKTKARLSGFEEVPAVLTDGEGKLKLKFDKTAQEIDYTLTWEGLEGGPATQAHIHIGQRLANGGIAVWLCANNPPITTAPAGTQPCPAGTSGSVSGTITPANVQAIPTQSLAAGDWEEFVGAIRRGLTYANIHNAASPGGEIRGQIGGKGKDDDDDDGNRGNGRDGDDTDTDD